MSARRLVPRDQFRRDARDAVDHYGAEAGERVALGLVDAIQAALRAIAARPWAGSPRYGHALNLPGLRSWPLKGYPYLVFYREGDDHIDLWRLLHTRRDIPVSLQGSD